MPETGFMQPERLPSCTRADLSYREIGREILFISVHSLIVRAGPDIGSDDVRRHAPRPSRRRRYPRLTRVPDPHISPGYPGPMKRIPTLATLAVGILLLSGCSQAATLAACGQVASEAVQVTGAINELSSPTPEAAQAALDEVRAVSEKIRGIDGPDDFVALRDSWTTSIDAFVAEGEKAIAGDVAGMDAASTQLRTTTDAMVAYCTP